MNITVRIALPPGITLDITEYERVRGVPQADEYALWAFAPGDEPSTATEWLMGLLTDVLEELPKGEWRLMP